MADEGAKPAPQEPAPPGPKPRRGCLLYGVIITILLLVAIVIAAWYGRRLYNQVTDTKPMQFPPVQMPPAEITRLQQQVDNFRDAIRAHQPALPLALTPEQINALLATDPDMQPLKGKLYVTGIQDNQIKADISVPMEQVGLTMLKGRYLNGTGTFTVFLRNGLLRITPQTIEAKGKPLPETSLAIVRKQNLAKSLNNNPRVSVALDRLQSIELKDGKLVIIPQPPQ